MHPTNLSRWQHSHDYSLDSSAAERRTRIVAGLTAVFMVVEIVCGMLFGSMALLADGWHMGTHALALGLSAIAYWYARRLAHDSRFAFGTWRVPHSPRIWRAASMGSEAAGIERPSAK
mgnify:CR=1 FL=1